MSIHNTLAGNNDKVPVSGVGRGPTLHLPGRQGAHDALSILEGLRRDFLREDAFSAGGRVSPRKATARVTVCG